MNVQYLSNEDGKKVAVQISIEDWKNIQAKLKRGSFLASLTQALVELKLMREGILPESEINELFDDSGDPVLGDVWDDLPNHVEEKYRSRATTVVGRANEITRRGHEEIREVFMTLFSITT